MAAGVPARICDTTAADCLNFRFTRDPGEIPRNGQGYQAEDEYLRYARQRLIDHPYP